MSTSNNVYEEAILANDVSILGSATTTIFTSAVHGSISAPELWMVCISIDVLSAAAIAVYDLVLSSAGAGFNGSTTSTKTNATTTATRGSVDINTLVEFRGTGLTIAIANNIATVGTAKAAGTAGGKTSGYAMYRIA